MSAAVPVFGFFLAIEVVQRRRRRAPRAPVAGGRLSAFLLAALLLAALLLAAFLLAALLLAAALPAAAAGLTGPAAAPDAPDSPPAWMAPAGALPGGEPWAIADTLEAIEAAADLGGVTDTIYVDAAREADLPVAPGPLVVTRVALESERGGADLAGILDAAAGLQVRRYGGLGAESVPSVRGATGAHVALLLDGLPVADAQDGLVDWGSLPLERFEAAEVYRGPAPARCGGGGAATVNLISRAPGESGASARLFTGSFGDRGGRGSAGWRSRDGSRAALALVHARGYDNRYRYLDHNQTFANAADDTERVRRNADAREWGGYLAGRWHGERWRAAASFGVFRRDAGRPGPLGHPSPDAGLRQERRDARLTLAGGADGSSRLDLAASRAVERLYDPLGQVGWDPPGTTRGRSDDLSGRAQTARAAELARLPGPWGQGRATLECGGEWRRQWYRESLNARTDPLRVRTTAGLFAGLRLDWYGPRLTLQPAWRWQRLTDNFPPVPSLPWLPETPLAVPHVQDAVSPSLAVVWEARPARLFWEAHASRSARPPTWVELFGHRGGIDGNRALRPEVSTGWDAGLRWRRAGGGLWVRVACFQTEIERTILFVQTSQRTSKPINFGRTRTFGLEWEGGGRLPAGGRWTANLTWQRARDRGDDAAYRDKELPFLPPLEAALQMTRPCGPFEIGLNAVHESANYRDRYNTAVERAPARTVLGFSLRRAWRASPWLGGADAVVTAEVVNLTDNAVYDVEGYPLPGRSARLSLALR